MYWYSERNVQGIGVKPFIPILPEVQTVQIGDNVVFVRNKAEVLYFVQVHRLKDEVAEVYVGPNVGIAYNSMHVVQERARLVVVHNQLMFGGEVRF